MGNEKKYIHFKLIRILKEETDKEHPMQQAVLAKKLGVHRNTVSRALSDLTSDSEHSRIYSTNLDNELDDEGEEINPDKRIYLGKVYYRHEFTPAELHWLIDGILFSRNVPHEDRDILIGKLADLGNQFFKDTKSLAKVRRLADDEPMNEQLFTNIETISKAIDQGKKISLVYNYMGPDFKLEPDYGDPNYRHLLNPYAIVARNGFYFLICNKQKYSSMSHYRLDRMTNVRIEDQPVKPVRELDGYKSGWDLQEYMKHNINMAFGKQERITFIAEPKAVRHIIDAFGRGVTFTKRKDGNLDCVVYVPLYDMERWVLQFGDMVTVTGPEELLEKLKTYSTILAEKYAGQ